MANKHDVIPGWVAKWGPGEAVGSASCHVGGGGGVGQHDAHQGSGLKKQPQG